VLQYLPDAAAHEQAGCARFPASAGAISFLPTSDKERTIQAQILATEENYFCTERNTQRCWPHGRKHWRKRTAPSRLRASKNGCA